MRSEKEYIEFISGLHNTVYRLARSIITDDVDAEDLVQDIFERVWRARDAVLNSSFPRAYVCRMAHNLAIDHQRARLRVQSIAISEQTETTSDGDKETNTKDIAALTHKLIQQLPERQRLAIHMRDIEGYELEEIAHILDSDEANVRVNLSRARKSIREHLIKIMNYGVE